MLVRGIPGVLLSALGVLWILQGIGTVHGSSMSGHGQYAVLGAFVLLIGVMLLLTALRVRRRR